jgi:hypothetical protein
MPVSVTASLVGTYSPRTVQVVVSGLTSGTAYSVQGESEGRTWPVRAGTGTASSSQIVLPDLAAPINVPVTYTAFHGTETATSAPITVNYPYSAVLQSLAGDMSVPMDLRDNGLPRRPSFRHSTFAIPGRRNPVVHYDIPSGMGGEFRVNTDGAETQTLDALLGAGAPLLVRTDGGVCDLEPVIFVLITDAPSSLLVGTRRRWELSYLVIDDPEPNTLVGLPTWDDFDASYTSDPVLTWDSFDAEWAGSTWNDFDVFDWATRAAS